MLTPDEDSKKCGRPSLFNPKFVKQAYELSLLGLTDEEMANVFDVSCATIYNWKRDFPEFLEATKRGKEQADAKVAMSLFRRATGYSHKAVKIMQYEGNPVEVDYIERYPPDTMACIYWLNNRQRKNWTQKPVDNGDDDNAPQPAKVEITVRDARKPGLE